MECNWVNLEDIECLTMHFVCERLCLYAITCTGNVHDHHLGQNIKIAHLTLALIINESRPECFISLWDLQCSATVSQNIFTSDNLKAESITSR